MSKKHCLCLTIIALFCISLFTVPTGFAIEVLTKDKALKRVFFKNAEIEVVTKELSEANIEKIKKMLGGTMVFVQEGSESEDVEEEDEIEFYFAKRGGKRLGVAIIDTQPGKWGAVVFIIAMDIKGTVKAVKVMSYSEQRGKPIVRASYMNQYKGKHLNSTLTVGKDIVGVSGATISSRAATFSVKKALAIYNVVFLNK